MSNQQSEIPVALLIVCHNGQAHLDDCLRSVLAADATGLCLRVLIVDNASTDGSLAHLRAHYPQIECLASPENLGFAGGNNLGWQHVRSTRPDTRYLALLNQDTIVTPNWLRALVDHLEAHPAVAAAQAKLRLHPQTDRLNSAGNRSHFLGFGYPAGFGEQDCGQFDQPTDSAASLDFASGAALLVRMDALGRVGLFDDRLFLYQEDHELSWKLRQVGLALAYVPQSVVYHKYVPNPGRAYYYLERNRLWLVLVYYKLLTLLLLAPASFAMELGQLVYALRHGLLAARLRAWGYFLRPSTLAALWRARRAAQRRRTIPDRQFLANFTGRLDTAQIRSPVLHCVANPILNAYWKLVRPLIRW